MSEIIQINEDTWRIEDNGVRFFLLTGTESALLIDSGMQTPNAREIAESITKLPLQLLNTHADILASKLSGLQRRPSMRKIGMRLLHGPK